MPSTDLAPLARQRFFDANGDPLAGGKLYTYEAGTTTPKATYTDRSGTTANTNPIILDANGECDIWIASGFYKFVLKDSSDVTQWTKDQIALPLEAALSSAFYRDVVYITTADSPYTLAQTHNGKIINIDSTSGNVTITLPEISSLTLPYNVALRKSVSANTITVNRSGTDTIDTGTSKTLSTIGAGAHLVADIDKSPDDWTSIDLGTVADGSITSAKFNSQAVNGATAVTAVKADSVLIADASDSGNVKKALVSTVKQSAIRSVSSYPDTATTADEMLILSGSSGTVNLPTAVGNDGMEMEFYHNGTSLTQVYTIDGNSSETIGGSTTVKLHTNGQYLKIKAVSSNWLIIESKARTGWVDGGALSIGATTTAPTKPTGLTVDKMYWRRNGSEARILFQYKQSNITSAANGSGDYLYAIPSNLTIDTANLSLYTTVEGSGGFTTSNALGSVLLNDTTNANHVGSVIVYDSTQVRIAYVGGVTSSTSQIGIVGSAAVGALATQANLFLMADFTVPILDWLP